MCRIIDCRKLKGRLFCKKKKKKNLEKYNGLFPGGISVLELTHMMLEMVSFERDSNKLKIFFFFLNYGLIVFEKS